MGAWELEATARQGVDMKALQKLAIGSAIGGWFAIPFTWLVTIGALAAFALPTVGSALELQLNDASSFSLVRLLGCHLTHWSGEHLFWDLGLFVFLGFMCERAMPGKFAVVVLLTALTVPFAVACVHPTITVYRGLSGIDTALFSLLASNALRNAWKSRDVWRLPLLIGWLSMWLKIAFEFLSGGVLFVQETNFMPVPISHLIGALVGLVVSLTAGLPPVSLAALKMLGQRKIEC